MKVSAMVLIVDWGIVLATVLDDFLNFLPGFLFLSLTIYIIFRLGYEVSNSLFGIVFGRSVLVQTKRSKGFFSLLLMSLFVALALGTPLKLNISPYPGAFPAILVFFLLLGGSIFTYLFSKELLRYSDFGRSSGPIPSFWRRSEKTGKDDDFEKNWKKTIQMPEGIAKKLSIAAFIYAPALLLVFVALVIAAIFSLTLYFSIVFDIVILGWLAFMSTRATLQRLLLTRVVSRPKGTKPEIEKSFIQSFLSGYSHFDPKTIGLSLCLLADLGAIVYNASPFLVLSSSLSSFLMSPGKLAAIFFPIILFGSIVSFELYSWWLMAKGTSNFLQAWHYGHERLSRTKPLPLWATLLFALAWYPLIIQEFLLGPHFYPSNKELSLAFLTSPGLHGWIAISVFVSMAIMCIFGLIKLAREEAIQMSRKDILIDNRKYGFVSTCLWISAALVWMFSESASPKLPLTALYVVLIAAYMADISRFIDKKFPENSWAHRVLYYGLDLGLIAFSLVLASQFAIFDATLVYVVLGLLCLLFVFFVWWDAKWYQQRKH
jgi:hypothetical protein